MITARFGSKVSFTIVPQGGSVRVVATVEGVGFINTEHEQPMALNNMSGGAEVMSDVNATLASL